MKVHWNALKHGVSSEDAIQAAEWSLWIERLDEDGPPHRELRLASTPEPACWRRWYSPSRTATRWSSTRCQLARSTSTYCRNDRDRHPDRPSTLPTATSASAAIRAVLPMAGSRRGSRRPIACMTVGTTKRMVLGQSIVIATWIIVLAAGYLIDRVLTTLIDGALLFWVLHLATFGASVVVGFKSQRWITKKVDSGANA